VGKFRGIKKKREGIRVFGNLNGLKENILSKLNENKDF
jgi:hypothetical protein